MLNAIVDAALRYKVLVLVAFALVVGLGIQAFREVPVDAFPDVTPVQVNIYTESPGLAAEDVENLLTTAIEGSMAGLPGGPGRSVAKVPGPGSGRGRRPPGTMALAELPPPPRNIPSCMIST